jgi:hypothetical protein
MALYDAVDEAASLPSPRIGLAPSFVVGPGRADE